MVLRALEAVVGGALDSQNEAELGRRMGISGRHLRRQFQEHLGVTPDQLARSQRAHFARRLLDDTDLTVIDVALAAGFGSARQMNRVFLDVFRATPKVLRAKRRSSDRLAADGGLVLRLPVSGPLNWEAMLGYLRGRVIPGVEAVSGSTYRRTALIEGDPAVLELELAASDTVLLRAHLPHWGGLMAIVSRARRIFSLDSDVASAEELMRQDQRLAHLVARFPGLRPLGAWDPFEIGVRAIVGQQVTVAGANTLTARIVEFHGVPVPGLTQLGLSHLFPSAEKLVEADLEAGGIPKGRADALRAFANAVASHELHLEARGRLEEFAAEISAIKGLGPWTAQYLALRLGEPDAFPASDLGLRRALSGEPRGVANPAVVARVAEGWRPFRAFAAMHLWMAGSRT